jgi:hypothetical protein
MKVAHLRKSMMNRRNLIDVVDIDVNQGYSRRHFEHPKRVAGVGSYSDVSLYHCPRQLARNTANAVELIGLMFQRQFHYDFRPYSAESHGDNPKQDVWLFVVEGFHTDLLVGACEFERGVFINVPPDISILQWIWLHPGYREKGVLTDAWPFFIERYGPIGVTHPISTSMDHFLRGCEKSYIMTTGDKSHPYWLYGLRQKKVEE